VIGAIVEEDEENWRDKEESLELAVLEAVTEIDRVKEASFCMRRGCVGEGVNSGGSLCTSYGRGCSDVLGELMPRY